MLDLARQGLGKNRARSLGSAVQTSTSGTKVRQDRAKVGHDSVLLLAQDGQHGAADGQLAQHVGVELREGLLGGNFLAGAGQNVAGGVDDDVDAAGSVLGVRDDARDGLRQDRVRRGHVEGLGDAGLRVRLGERGGDARRVARGGEDDVALGEGAAGDLAAEAGGGAGDEPDFGGGGGRHFRLLFVDVG